MGSILESRSFDRTRRAAAECLLARRAGDGTWSGVLSSSALSTATAVTALRLTDQRVHAARIARGADWLVATQLTDGSWGDTTASRGNLSTTLLCWAALRGIAAAARDGVPTGSLAAALERSEAWIRSHTGSLEAEAIASALAGIYGRDRTFSVPILTHVALCGGFGDPAEPRTWQVVPQLPCELAALPQSWFRLVDMQVVSYALPALIAIGQVRHARLPTWGPGRFARAATRAATLRTLAAIQPVNGGFLEATPLTSFVTMSLAGMGLADHPVARRGGGFLTASQREDGSWPIDTNLATWVTSLSVAALAAGGRLHTWLDGAGRETLRTSLLERQWRTRHPYTGAAPGGWAWTDLPGGVPDADDTSGAVAALAMLEAAERRPPRGDVIAAARAGLGWLVNLANRDGGMPTFCRGWGRLPFDTSCPDITAHFLRASDAWKGLLPAALPPRLPAARGAAERYLVRTQARDGCWTPLWFGNEHHADQANPTYGTAKVVVATGDARGAEWLMGVMGDDGSVGAGPGLPPSIEETAVTVEALARVAATVQDPAPRRRLTDAIERGVGWLVERTAEGTSFPSAPIGLYFAKLWYAEELYPLSFTVAALETAARLTVDGPPDAGPSTVPPTA